MSQENDTKQQSKKANDSKKPGVLELAKRDGFKIRQGDGTIHVTLFASPKVHRQREEPPEKARKGAPEQPAREKDHDR